MRVDLRLQGIQLAFPLFQRHNVIPVDQSFDIIHHPVKACGYFPHLIPGHHFYLLAEIPLLEIFHRDAQSMQRLGNNIGNQKQNRIQADQKTKQKRHRRIYDRIAQIRPANPVYDLINNRSRFFVPALVNIIISPCAALNRFPSRRLRKFL